MDTRPVKWHPVAIKDLVNIFDYTFIESPQNEVMFYKTLLDLSETSAIYTERYPAGKLLNTPSIRLFLNGTY